MVSVAEQAGSSLTWLQHLKTGFHDKAQIMKTYDRLILFYWTGTDVPVLLLVFSAGPVNISFADIDSRVDAIIQCFFPAQATGEALYNVLTMTTPDASPAGRLPYTWYDTADQVRDISKQNQFIKVPI